MSHALVQSASGGQETTPVYKPPFSFLFRSISAFNVLSVFSNEDVFNLERTLKVATDFSGINIDLVSVSFLSDF